MLNKTFERINLMNKALDGAWMRNSAISHNIANVNTPGYKRQTVEFEDILRQELGKSQSIPMKKTNPMHMDPNHSAVPQIKTISDSSYRVDGNNVDIDVESAEMAKNTIYYNAIISQVNGQFSRMKQAINSGK